MAEFAAPQSSNMLDIVAELVLFLRNGGCWIYTCPIFFSQEIAVGMGSRRKGERLDREHMEARDHLPTWPMIGPLQKRT